MGRVAAPFAVQGWVKVQPFTEYLDSLLDYPIWWLRPVQQPGKDEAWRQYRLLDGQVHGQQLIVQLEGIGDRDQAERIRGLEIAVPREELPEAEEDEYYWDDLIGLEVVNQDGATLGRVTGLLETGVHDVLEVMDDRKRLIPFTEPIVVEVDRETGRILVDWGLDY